MSAMIGKELREHLHWSALFCLLMTVTLFLGLSNDIDSSPLVGRWSETSFLWATTWIPALVGLALGLLQTMPEQRPDLWAFLVHRPLDRSTLFLSKVVSGLLIIGAVLIVPTAVAILWCATPGHVPAPFHGTMVLPAIADLLCGSVYYFAGLLIGSREARWFGSRLVPLGWPICLSVAAHGVSEFWQAALLAILGAGIGFVAAWGAFCAAPSIKPQTIRSTLAQGVVLVAGTTLIAIVILVAASAVFPRRPATWEYYAVDRDGIIYRVKKEESRVVELSDRAGHALPAERVNAINRGSLTLGIVWNSQIARKLPPGPNYRSAYRVLWTLNGHNSASIWHYSVPWRLLLEYDPLTNRLVGGLGPNGYFSYSTEQQKPHTLPPGFPEPCDTGWAQYVDNDFLVFQQGNKLFRADLKSLQLREVLRLGVDERLVATGHAAVGYAAVTNRRLIYFGDFDPSKQGHVSLPLEPRERPRPGWYLLPLTSSDVETPREFFVAEFPDISFSGEVFVTRFDKAGKVQEKFRLPEVQDYIAEVGEVRGVLIGSAPFGPAAMRYLRQQFPPSFRDPTPIRLGVATSIILSVLSVLVMFLTRRQYGMGVATTVLWCLVALAMGAWAFVLRSFMGSKPVREPCPACGASRVVLRRNCEHCGAGWPSPTLRGTEIFA
jgi:MFS family permease